MNKRMKRNVFLWVFSLYIAGNSILFLTKISIGHDWFSQWIFDKFFVFQFISAVTIGLVMESRYCHHLSFVRIGSRRKILRNELLSSYWLGFMCLNIMFVFIILGAFLLKESHYIFQLMGWYIRYLLGIVVFIHIMSCLKWSNSLILSKYCMLFSFIWLTIELMLLKPYVKKFFAFDLNVIFSWIFHDGAMSYFCLLLWITLTLFLNIRLSDKRDFI